MLFILTQVASLKNAVDFFNTFNNTLSNSLSFLALLVSAISFLTAWCADRRTRKAESIKELLGEKESVAFAALRLNRDGLPKNKRQRNLIIEALIQACIFEGSDRTRALLYFVIQKNYKSYSKQFEHSYKTVASIFKVMGDYKKSTDQSTQSEILNLKRGRERLEILRIVLDVNAKQARSDPEEILTENNDRQNRHNNK